ncbi:hypothetical protein DL765_008383 [Monosporascus sp. GIB2]|nr:hypothetical protein DL765_008383 [Monosporascus sp. GIB2]
MHRRLGRILGPQYLQHLDGCGNSGDPHSGHSTTEYAKEAEDFHRTWDVAEDYILSYLEINAGIICASVPALRPFFLRFLPTLVTSSLSSSDRNTSTRQRRRSFGLNTVVEQNRQRRMMQQNLYELSSIDENAKQPSEDDEAALWSPGRKEGAVKDNAKSKAKDPEHSIL